ncbi:MAG: aminopeptidase [Clostridia bacterium]|nr:aminopeptidase [Clostridia bacterium]
MHTFEDKLKEYAELLVRVGVNVQKGQDLVITSQVDQASFARLCVQAAYEAGARAVDMAWSDDAIARMTYLNADESVFDVIPEYRIRFNTDYAEGGACFLHLVSSDPENLKGVDPSRLERAHRAYGKYMRRYRELGMASAFPWSIGALASPAWAKRVFPDLPEAEAVAALWEKIFMAVRITGDGTAVEKWRQHQENLQRHVDILNGYAFDRLHYYNALGSDFTVGLCKGHIWCAGGEKTPKGQFFMPNMPTEEIFTAPDRNRCDGVICAALPLSKDGNVIRDIRFVVKEGKIVEATASANEELLRKSIAVDEGASRFGEVALVPYDSPISNSKTLFYNTLFDENAACHLAFGEAYPTTVEGALDMSEEERLSAGLNKSITHVDFMVGTADLSIDGYTADGRCVPVFRDGNFVF